MHPGSAGVAGVFRQIPQHMVNGAAITKFDGQFLLESEDRTQPVAVSALIECSQVGKRHFQRWWFVYGPSARCGRCVFR